MFNVKQFSDHDPSHLVLSSRSSPLSCQCSSKLFPAEVLQMEIFNVHFLSHDQPMCPVHVHIWYLICFLSNDLPLSSLLP